MTAPGTAREEHQAMEFSVTKSALLNELSTTQGVVERKTTIPILSNLLVEAKGTLDHTGRRRAQNDNSYSVESAGRG